MGSGADKMPKQEQAFHQCICKKQGLRGCHPYPCEKGKKDGVPNG